MDMILQIRDRRKLKAMAVVAASSVWLSALTTPGLAQQANPSIDNNAPLTNNADFKEWGSFKGDLDRWRKLWPVLQTPESYRFAGCELKTYSLVNAKGDEVEIVGPLKAGGTVILIPKRLPDGELALIPDNDTSGIEYEREPLWIEDFEYVSSGSRGPRLFNEEVETEQHRYVRNVLAHLFARLSPNMPLSRVQSAGTADVAITLHDIGSMFETNLDAIKGFVTAEPGPESEFRLDTPWLKMALLRDNVPCKLIVELAWNSRQMLVDQAYVNGAVSSQDGVAEAPSGFAAFISDWVIRPSEERWLRNTTNGMQDPKPWLPDWSISESGGYYEDPYIWNFERRAGDQQAKLVGDLVDEFVSSPGVWEGPKTQYYKNVQDALFGLLAGKRTGKTENDGRAKHELDRYFKQRSAYH
jgi:hypothetical protein